MSGVELALAVGDELGEAPTWSASEGVLHWVDIGAPVIHRYRPTTGEHLRRGVSEPVTGLGLGHGGTLVAVTRTGFAIWDVESDGLHRIPASTPSVPLGPFNDGAVGPGGRFWAGTTSTDGSACLCRLDPDGRVHVVESGITFANGLGWSPDGSVFYLTDSLRRVILAYDFDRATGSIANRRVFAEVHEEVGVPDGLAVDEEGGVWSVRCRAGLLVRYDVAGHVDLRVRTPVTCVTSCAFGGPDLDQLFVTSSRALEREGGGRPRPMAGDLFRFRPGVRGLPTPVFGACPPSQPRAPAPDPHVSESSA